MIRLTLDATQLARARFAVSPLLQFVQSLLELRQGSSRLAYRWAAMSPASRPATGYLPDFLSPCPERDRPTWNTRVWRIMVCPFCSPSGVCAFVS